VAIMPLIPCQITSGSVNLKHARQIKDDHSHAAHFQSSKMLVEIVALTIGLEANCVRFSAIARACRGDKAIEIREMAGYA
jgi:hypothetical protein